MRAKSLLEEPRELYLTKLYFVKHSTFVKLFSIVLERFAGNRNKPFVRSEVSLTSAKHWRVMA